MFFRQPTTRRRLLAPIVLTGWCAIASACLGRPANSTALIPPLLDVAVDERHPGWRLATFSGDATCQAAAGENPAVVSGDLDSDGRIDRALLIETPKGLQIVAGIRGLDAFRVFDLDTVENAGAGRYLTLEPRGRRFPSGVSGIDDYLSHVTVALATCGSTAKIAYVWAGSGFRRVRME
jgi:hypothetical protein